MKQLNLNDNIIIQDWTGKTLYQGNYKSKEVDKVLDSNRCNSCKNSLDTNCDQCDDTGYSGDFEVMWENEDFHKNDNVYEFINY